MGDKDFNDWDDWDFWAELKRAPPFIDNLFRNTWTDLRGRTNESFPFRPSCDLGETKTDLLVRCDLPGMKKDDVFVQVEGNDLVIQGESKYDNEEDSESHTWFRRERSRGVFQRRFSLPYGVDPDGIRAQFKGGSLRVAVPKPAKVQKQINVVKVPFK
eukprot:TRINITY_DN143_c0_g1_i1.p1 TRINITY_DN143_c0_g1~~TRINITY_DN143_c0_g1_i1.p1  ORF type:complete len:169 (+),score=40.81 TRINITY_DN143_c0_g1_i1:36-509(+)